MKSCERCTPPYKTVLQCTSTHNNNNNNIHPYLPHHSSSLSLPITFGHGHPPPPVSSVAEPPYPPSIRHLSSPHFSPAPPRDKIAPSHPINGVGDGGAGVEARRMAEGVYMYGVRPHMWVCACMWAAAWHGVVWVVWWWCVVRAVRALLYSLISSSLHTYSTAPYTCCAVHPSPSTKPARASLGVRTLLVPLRFGRGEGRP